MPNLELPPNASFSLGSGLFWGEQEQYVGDFIPHVQDMLEVTCDGKTEKHVRFSIIFTDGSESGIFTLPLSGTDVIDWFSLDQRCHVDPDCTK